MDNITFTYDKTQYTLYYTRATVEAMENAGFDIRKFDEKIYNNVKALFYGAFRAEHSDTKRVTMDKIWEDIPNKSDFIEALVMLYSEPYNTLMDEPKDEAKKISWKVNQ